MIDKSRFDEIIKSMEALILDERKIVTYKSLSRLFNIHPNTAKQLLYSFATTHVRNDVEISCAYQISGRKEDGSYYSVLINEENIVDVRNSFTDIFSEIIYSVHPNKLEDLQVLYAVDTLDDTSSMDCRVITCSECVVLPDHEIAKKPVVLKKPEEKQVVSKKPQEVKQAPKQEPAKKKEQEVKKPEKKTNSISSMFSAQNQKPKVDKPTINEQKKPENEKKPEEKKEKQPKKRKSVKAEEDDKKRKRIRVFSSSSEDEQEEIEEKQRSPTPEPIPTAFEPEPEEEISHKRKKRKLVDKTVMTPEGYIETIKEVVYLTDSEEEQPAAKKSPKVTKKSPKETKKSPKKSPKKNSPKKSPKKNSPKKSPKKNSPKKGKAKPTTDGKKQSTLYSFFKKA